MGRMKSMDIEIREMLKSNKDVIGLDNCIKDLAIRFNVSYEQMSLYVEELLSNPTDGGMSFQDEYTKKRWEGK